MTTLRRRTLLSLLAATPGAVLAGRANADPTAVRIRDLYAHGAGISDAAQSLAGQEVVVAGFMAPPLKPDASFFVLTKMPMSVCPFCDNAANWPSDIVFVRLRGRQDWVDFNVPIEVTGQLDLGEQIDEETGFVSLLRVIDAEFETL